MEQRITWTIWIGVIGLAVLTSAAWGWIESGIPAVGLLLPMTVLLALAWLTLVIVANPTPMKRAITIGLAVLITCVVAVAWMASGIVIAFLSLIACLMVCSFGWEAVILTGLAVPITCLINSCLVDMGLVIPDRASSAVWGIAVFLAVGLVLAGVWLAILTYVDHKRKLRIVLGEGFPR